MRWILRILAVMLALVILLPLAVVVGLNTGAGRNFAMREINRLAAGKIQITGLAGHFPADLKLAHLEVADDTGVWLTGDDVQLRWQPLACGCHRADGAGYFGAARAGFQQRYGQ
jgi:translocation and assembly module TamB